VSCEDFKGSVHAFREFMRREQDAIERGERVGVSVKWARADPRQTMTSPTTPSSNCSPVLSIPPH
jgi:hypothetical protein